MRDTWSKCRDEPTATGSIILRSELCDFEELLYDCSDGRHSWLGRTCVKCYRTRDEEEYKREQYIKKQTEADKAAEARLKWLRYACKTGVWHFDERGAHTEVLTDSPMSQFMQLLLQADEQWMSTMTLSEYQVTPVLVAGMKSINGLDRINYLSETLQTILKSAARRPSNKRRQFDLDLQIDVHGITTKWTEYLADEVIRIGERYTTKVAFIHGYRHGTAIKDALARYATSNNISMNCDIFNPGMTTFVVGNPHKIRKQHQEDYDHYIEWQGRLSSIRHSGKG